MATFFGEILPVTSRAFDDDEEDEECLQTESCPSLLWSTRFTEEINKSPNKKVKCDSLIIAVGQAATGFTQAYVIENGFEAVGGLVSDESIQTFEQLQKTTNERTCFMHRSKDKRGVFVCQCRCDVSPEQCFSWVQQVTSSIDLSTCDVTVLCSAMTSEYKSDVPISDLSPPFLRGLRTSCCEGSLSCKQLEQPNMLTCLPAQVLSYCEMYKVKASVYVSYTESIFLDIPTMRAFKPLLTSTPLKQIVQDASVGDKMLLKIVDQQTNQSTLYM